MNKNPFIFFIFIILLIQSCELNAPTLTGRSVERKLQAEGLSVTRLQDTIELEDGLSSKEKSECLNVIQKEIEAQICLYRYPSSRQAIEAGTKAGLKPWPAGKTRRSFVSGVVYVTFSADKNQGAFLERLAVLLQNIE